MWGTKMSRLVDVSNWLTLDIRALIFSNWGFFLEGQLLNFAKDLIQGMLQCSVVFFLGLHKESKERRIPSTSTAVA